MADVDTRTRLLDAAQDLVQRVGANAMSYQHLSDAVGIRKASIHHHFPTKSDLLVALIERYHDDFLGLVDGLIAEGRDGADRLRRYMGLFEATLRRDACEKACPCGMLGAEVATLEPRAAARLRRFYEANDDRLATILAAGRADGSLRFEGEPATLARTLFAALEGAMLVARVDGGLKQFKKIAGQLRSLAGAR
jgi:TetR/AcrR family transcriptional repressor of nem operon